jgi:hypothetical protein
MSARHIQRTLVLAQAATPPGRRNTMLLPMHSLLNQTTVVFDVGPLMLLAAAVIAFKLIEWLLD